MADDAGTVLTCSNDDCDCLLRVERPCPHGDTYTCACGYSLEPAGPGTSDMPVTPGA